MRLLAIFRRQETSIYAGIVAGVIYGVFVRLIFAFHSLRDFFSIVTIGFIFLVPLVLGFLTVYYGESVKKRGWLYRIFMPWVSSLVLMLVAFLVGWEGAICIIMALPIFLLMSSVGGIFAALVFSDRPKRFDSYPALIAFAALPFISASIEGRLILPNQIRNVETEVQINASPMVVWQNIERVREIKSYEHKQSIFHSIGFPRPVEATLSQPGVGGVRHATFEGGVLFVETITAWEPERELTFNISADTASIPSTTLDEHVTIGGRYFDVLEGTYRVEPLTQGGVLLHLSSKHRLSTRFNFYAGLWTSLIMRDIQRNILDIIKRRCEVTP